MELSITQTSSLSDEQWDTYWAQSDQATFSHSREWHHVWKVYTRGAISPAPLTVEFSDGKTAVVPLSVHSVLKGMVNRYLSSPATSYGGWFSSAELTENHHALLINYLSMKFPALIIRFNPLLNYQPDAGFGKYLKRDMTQMITFEGDFSSQFKTWTKGHKSAVSKAVKAGVTTRLADSAADWDVFYKMYVDSFERWGDKATSRYRPAFFQAIRDLNSRNVQLWLADYQGKTVAGSLIFYSKRHAMYGYSAALGEYFNLRAMNVLLHDVIKDACERKFISFDLSPSGGHSGVASFKKSFGAHDVPAYILERQPGWVKLMEKLYKQWLLRFSKT